MITKIWGLLTFVGAVSWVTLNMVHDDVVTWMGANRIFANGLYIATAMAAVYTLVFTLTASRKKS